MNPLKRDKGSHKDYAYWLSTEINDYTFKTDDVDSLKQYEAVLSDTIQAQDLETDSNSINTLLQKKKPKRGPKTTQMNFTFLPNITKLPIHILVNICSFLQTKDIFGLLSTCKQLNTTFDDDNVWRTLCRRDPTQIDEERLSYVESAKDLYKYIVYRNKPEMIHHTGLFWKNGVPLASKLAQSVVDFVTPKKHAIKEALHILILRNDPSKIGNILKLSWLREENEAWLWFSGLVWIKLVDRNTEKVERLTSHVMKVYRGLDTERIQNAFFLEDRYIVLEVVTYLNENEEEEEKDAEMIEKIASTFIIYDLEKELRCLMIGEDFDEPFRYCYEESLAEVLEEKEEKILEDNGQEGEVEVNPNKALKIKKNKKVKVKLLNEEEAIFYTTDKAYSWIKVVNLKTKSESSSVKVELNSPIEDIIFLKNVPLVGRNSFYVIDKTLNVYPFAWTNNCLSLVKKIIPKSESEDVLKQKNQIKPQDSRGFPEVCRYSQGIYQKQVKDEPDMIVEYLVVNKESMLYFIELDTLEVHNYSLKTPYNNWTIFKDKLFVVNGSQVMIYQFSFHDFEIKEVENLKTTIKISNGFVTQAIYVDSCHTIQIICYKNPKKGDDIFGVYIGSTQFMLSAAYMKCSYNNPAYMTCPYNRYEEFEISGLLSKNRKGIIPLLAKDQLEIKFEKEGLLLKSPSRTVLFELERAKGFDRTLKANKAYKKIDFYDMKEKKEEVKEDNQVVKEKPIIHYQEILENRNNLGRKEKQNAWSAKGEKTNKEDNQEKQMVRHKGQKYRKNVQQNQRSEKHD